MDPIGPSDIMCRYGIFIGLYLRVWDVRESVDPIGLVFWSGCATDAISSVSGVPVVIEVGSPKAPYRYTDLIKWVGAGCVNWSGLSDCVSEGG